MKSMIHIRDLLVEKSGRTICRVPELAIRAGERVGIVGVNGSGKTTLLRIVGALENDYAGMCHVDVPRLGRVYVHQSPYFFRGSVLFNATYGLKARGVPRRKRIAVAEYWLTRLGVAHLARRHCGSLSAGERRRVALARTFALEPDVLLLDEPLADLDPAGVDIVCRAIADASNSTILIASPNALPDSLPVRTYSMRNGG